MTNRKELEVALRDAEALGLVVSKSRSHHWKVYDGGRLIASTGSTPSDGRSVQNFRATIRRYLRTRPDPDPGHDLQER